jgi:hypothetical protein
MIPTIPIATKQEDNEDNDEYKSERHWSGLLCLRRAKASKLRIAVTAGASERNHHRQVELKLRALLKNKKWLDTHTVKGPGGNGDAGY